MENFLAEMGPHLAANLLTVLLIWAVMAVKRREETGRAAMIPWACFVMVMLFMYWSLPG